MGCVESKERKGILTQQQQTIHNNNRNHGQHQNMYNNNRTKDQHHPAKQNNKVSSKNSFSLTFQHPYQVRSRMCACQY